MSKPKLVVVGAGMASGRVLEHLFETDPAAYDVTLFSAEPRGNYNRIMLSPVLSGEKTYEEIVTHDADWYRAHGVDCRFGESIVKIDRARKVVVSAGGETPYDKLLIATGSAPVMIPVPGRDFDGVMAYRDLDDVERISRQLVGLHRGRLVLRGDTRDILQDDGGVLRLVINAVNDVEGLLASLQNVDGVVSVQAVDGDDNTRLHLDVRVHPHEEAARHLPSWLDAQGLALFSLVHRRRTLEDVFLELGDVDVDQGEAA